MILAPPTCFFSSDRFAWLKDEASQQLTILQDWCFHDGTVFEGKPISLIQLEAMCRDEDAVRHLSDDTLVSTAVYPEDMSFYWRWGMRSDCDEVPFRGSFDFTARETILDQIDAPGLLDVLIRLPASEFFGSAHLPVE